VILPNASKQIASDEDRVAEIESSPPAFMILDIALVTYVTDGVNERLQRFQLVAGTTTVLDYWKFRIAAEVAQS
jgi:hypothetical protein